MTRTTSCLGADGGVRRLVDVEAELADVGIRTDQLVPWLLACGGAVVHDLAVLVSGPLAEVVERLLDAHGSARTAGQIAADLASGGRAVDEAMLASVLGNRRFARAADGAVGLASWSDKARRAVGGGPRSRPRPRLQRPTTRATDRVGVPAGEAPGGPERLWLWVRVDSEVLRGSEAAVPVALVEGLGLAPLTRRTFSSRWGPVTLAHEHQPTRGSVRAVALAAGARRGDTLLLGFSAAGDVAVEVRHGAQSELAQSDLAQSDLAQSDLASEISPPDMTSRSAVIFAELATGGTQ
jgi:hypothetical protein